MSNFRKELDCQIVALNNLSHKDKNLIMKYVNWHKMVIMKVFRDVINDFENNKKRLPESDELIKITSEILKTDITKIFK